jgi:hypothetical protein
MSTSDLPALNATLNATSAVLLAIGWMLIRSGRIAAHRRFMIAAFVTSSSSRFSSSITRRLDQPYRQGRDARHLFFDSDPARRPGGRRGSARIITLSRGSAVRRSAPAHASWTCRRLFVSVTGDCLLMLYQLA